MSSMNTTTNLSNSGIETELIRYIKYAGAFVNLTNMTRYSYNQYLEEKAGFGMSYGPILI
jgi:hypothetical protein